MIRAPTRWLVHGSFLFGLLFLVLPLPAALQDLRPYLLAMLLAYWLIEAPNRVGLGTAFVLGLMADIISASTLGEQALRLLVLTFLVQRFRARLRFFPLSQQAVAIGLLLANDRLLAWLLHRITEATQAGWAYWLSPLVGVFLWPWLYVLIDQARLRARERS